MKTIFSDRNIIVLTISGLISALSFRLWMPYWSLYALELGVNKEMLGILSMIQAGTLLILQVPGGILADRLGRKKLIVISAIFDILTPFLYMLAKSWSFLVLGSISQAVSWSCMPALNAIVIESLPGDQRGTGLGVYKLVTWLPRMLMEFLGGIILDHLGLLPGFKVILAWSTIASVLILVLLAWGLRETLDLVDRKVKGLEFNLSELPKGIIPLIVVGGVSSFAARITMPFMVVYAVEIIGLSKSQWGFITMITGILSVGLGTLGGFLSDKIGRKPCLLVSRIVEPFSKLLFIKTNGFNQVLTVQGFAAVGSAVGGGLIMKGLLMGGPAWQALVADIVEPSDRGRVMGLLGSAQILLGLPSTWLGGYLWDNYSPDYPFWVSGLLGFLAPIILYTFM